jgi:hypothetical protein
LEDLFVNNYRLQGLAEKKPETKETTLVKRIKLGVRSVKVLGWIGSKESNRSRGFSRKRTRHKKQSTYYNFLEGPKCKAAHLLIPFDRAVRSKQGGGGGPGGRRRRCSGELGAQVDREIERAG